LAAISDFFPYVLPSVPGCSIPVATQALVRAARMFCQYTDAVQFTTDPADIKKGVATYDLDIPAQTEVQSFRDFWMGKRPLDIKDQYGVATPFALVDLVAGEKAPQNDPVQVYIRPPLTVTLYPTPKADLAKGLTARVALRPALTADTFPDALANDWLEAVSNGAIYLLAKMPSQPFTNPAVAADAQGIFYQQMGLAKLETWRGKGMAEQTVSMRPLA